MNQLRDIRHQFLGEIRLYAFDFVPDGWMPCEGQLLPIREYDLLHNFLGDIYGGDGLITFGLPNLNLNFREEALPGAVPMRDKGIHYCIAVQGESIESLGENYFISQINFFPYSKSPISDFDNHWLPCDGRMLDVGSYGALFRIIGNKFGGDGKSKFALPNLPDSGDRTGYCKYYICFEGVYPHH